MDVLQVLVHPLTSLVLSLVLGAIAVSGKFSRHAANLLLFTAGLVGVFAIMRSGTKDWRLVLAGICAVSAITLSLSWWIKPTPSLVTPSSPTASPALRSYLVMTLIIDKVGKDMVQFHFLLKNNGPQEVTISHLVYKSFTKTAWEGSEEPVRTVIPGGELVTNGVVDRSDLPGNLSAMASYSMSGFDKTMTAQYGFRIRAIDLQPKNVLGPTSREETVNKELVPYKIILDGLRRPVGSFTFWFPERLPDGRPNNMTVSAGPSRRITFDPVSRTVHLTMISNGKLFQLERPLLEPKQGMHFVGATWDDVGNVHLFVDGSEKPRQP